jgi:hypothetical protein
MTVKVEGCHPNVCKVVIKRQNSRILRRPQDDRKSGRMSSYVCKVVIKRQNSRILRRPQDDRKSGGMSS